jgi:hypothetical protein
LQCYSQQPSYGNSQDAPLVTIGLRKYFIYAHGVLLSHEEE